MHTGKKNSEKKKMKETFWLKFQQVLQNKTSIFSPWVLKPIEPWVYMCVCVYLLKAYFSHFIA